MNLVDIKNLNISFGQNHVVRDVFLHVKKGELVALVGESGSGKSVTALSVLQLLQNARTEGSVSFNGTEVSGASSDVLSQIRGKKVGVIFQEPMTSLNPLHTIRKQLTESILLHNPLATKAQILERINELLDNVELSILKDRLDAYPHELSGGQRQRIMIAMAIANNPELLIADEPTTALDVIVSAQILALLTKLQKQHKMAILLITHDLTIVKKLADRVYVMKDGIVVETGKTAHLYEYPKHLYTKRLLASEPKGLAVRVSSEKNILEAKHLNVSFPIKGGILNRKISEVKAVRDVSIKIPEGKTIGIVGESGSGKTTMALGLMRLIDSTGKIVFMHKGISNLKGEDLRKTRRNMQIVFQDPYASLNPRMTIEKIIGEGLRAHNLSADIGAILEEVGLDRSML
jgi:microcin C transport system ATP-binding protein